MNINACIVAPLFVEHELTPAAQRALRQPCLVAPSVLFDEVANILRKYSLRDALPAEQIVLALERIDKLLEALINDRSVLPAAVRLAVEHCHPVYDCLYLAVALERSEALATADRRLAALAGRLSIDVHLIEPVS